MNRDTRLTHRQIQPAFQAINTTITNDDTRASPLSLSRQSPQAQDSLCIQSSLPKKSAVPLLTGEKPPPFSVEQERTKAVLAVLMAAHAARSPDNTSNVSEQGHTPARLPAGIARRVAGTVLASSISGLTLLLSAQTATKRPNLIFIYGEGQRADALSASYKPGTCWQGPPNHDDRIGHEGVQLATPSAECALLLPHALSLSRVSTAKTSGALANSGCEQASIACLIFPSSPICFARPDMV